MMKKTLFIIFLLISFLAPQTVLAFDFHILKKNEKKEESLQDVVTTQDNKKSFFSKFSQKYEKNKNNTDKDINTPTASGENNAEDTTNEAVFKSYSPAQQKAVEYANSSLFGEYIQERQKAYDNLVEGQVQKGTSPDGTETVEGYIHETFILSLDDCITKALQNNPEIRSAFSNTEIYKTHIGQAWANYFPSLNVTSGYTRNRYFSVNFAVPQRYYNLFNAVTASGSQLLFDFGKTKATADMSKRTYESSLANLDETINTVIYDVKVAYYSVLYSLAKQAVYDDSVKSYEMQLKQAEAFYNIGTKPKIDVTMAEYNLGNAQLGYIKATNELSLAKAQLNNAMGLPKASDYRIMDKLTLKEYDYDFDSLLEKAYQSRPELLAYKKKVEASQMLIRSSKRAFFPNVEAIGSYQIGGGTQFTDDYGWTIGAQLAYNNVNFMLLKKQVDEAKAAHKKDVADLNVMENKLHLEVEEAYINLKNSTESIPVTALSLKHAKEQYRLASGRYRVGEGNAIELKDSEITYRNARLDYLAALLQYNISVANMEKVIGFKLKEKIGEDIR